MPKRKVDILVPEQDSLISRLKRRREEIESEPSAEALERASQAGGATAPAEDARKYLEHFNDEEILRKGHNTSSVYHKGNFIQKAIKRPGALTRKAKGAGMSVGAYAQKHKHDSGRTGRQARLAITLRRLAHK